MRADSSSDTVARLHPPAVAAFVQSGAIDAREAHRKAFDRDGLVNQLKHAGVDTSFVERLA